VLDNTAVQGYEIGCTSADASRLLILGERSHDRSDFGHQRPLLPAPPALPPSMKIRVVASVIERGGRLLVCQRPVHKRHGGLWEFPGGKVEPGESTFAAVERELAEELGVRVRGVGGMIFAIDDPGSPFVIEFMPVEIEGEPACLEHSGIEWAGVEELLTLPLAPGDLAFARFYLGGSEVDRAGLA
jgi:8-oxo-dGTP diphosphatase